MALGDGIRRNIAQVEPTERTALRDAIIEMHHRFYPGLREDTPPGHVSWWFKQDEIHQATHVHGGPEFLPWHRELTNRFEELLRQINPQLSLHYWDFAEDPTNIPNANLGGGMVGTLNIFDANLFGLAIANPGDKADPDAGGDNVDAGEPWLKAKFYDPLAGQAGHPPFRGAFDGDRAGTNNPVDLPRHMARTKPAGKGAFSSHAEEDDIISKNSTFPTFRAALEVLHDRAHVYLANVSLHVAFRDPLVFLLHSNVDRIYAKWQTDPAHPERLDPATLYGSESNLDVNVGGEIQNLTHLVEPWSTGQGKYHDIRPWEPQHENSGVQHTYHDIRLVAPPPYDPQFQRPTAGVITGRVTDREAGTGIADASVLVRSGSVILPGSGNTLQLSTDSGGFYTTPVIPPVAYEVSAVQSGFVPLRFNVIVGMPVTQRDFPLVRTRPFTIKGMVTGTPGTPIQGATVTLVENTPVPGILKATTDSKGLYSLTMNPGPYDGDYTVTADASGFASKTVAIRIQNGATIPLNFPLAKLGSITGVVVADIGRTPIAGATVTSGSASATTDSAGRYSLTMLAPGDYTITAIARGFESGQAAAKVTDGGTTTTNFRLAKAATGVIAGNVSDDDGPINHASVTAQTVWGQFSADTDLDGNYTLAGLPAGQTQVSATARRHAPLQQSAQVTAGQTARLDFVLFKVGRPGPTR